MTKGRDAYQKKNYVNAQKYYSKALKIEPNLVKNQEEWVRDKVRSGEPADLLKKGVQTPDGSLPASKDLITKHDKELIIRASFRKYPRAEHVALSLPPIGGLKACPLKEASGVVPKLRVKNAVVPHNALFLPGILHICGSCPHQDPLYLHSNLAPKNDCPNRVSFSYKGTA